MEQIFHCQFSLQDAAIFGCKYTKTAYFMQKYSSIIQREFTMENQYH